MKHIKNNTLNSLILICTCILCCSCTYNQENYIREAYPGFYWKEFTGAGLNLKVQENDSIKFTSNSDTIFIKKFLDTKDPILQPVIKVFDLKNNDINSLLKTLPTRNDFKVDSNWYNLANCEFSKVYQDNNTQKYILIPKGKAKIEMDKLGIKEPIPFTCGGFGVGNSGARYFTTFKNLPNKAIFVEIGQDAPLFDEKSITPVK